MSPHTRYIVTDIDLEEVAQELLRAQINAERAYEHEGGPGDLFEKYTKLMKLRYHELAAKLAVQAAPVRRGDGRMAVMFAERIMHKTILSIPPGLEPLEVGMQQISSDIYDSLRRQSLVKMGVVPA